MYFTSSAGISQNLLGISSFLSRFLRGARCERLHLVRAASPLPIDAKSRDRPMRTRRGPGNSREAVA